MTATHKIIPFTVFLLFKLSFVSAQNDWKLTTEKEAIKIYTSIVPNSKIKAIKVQCEFQAKPSQIVALLLDVESAPNWIYHTKSCILVKQVSPSELYYYSEVEVPWPLENRDFVAHLTVTQNPTTKVVIIDGPSVSGQVPVKKGIVRINNSKGKWIITPASNNRVNVEYTLHADPGGAIPTWLINTFATEGPLQIFKQLQLQLQKPAYKNAKLSYIKN